MRIMGLYKTDALNRERWHGIINVGTLHDRHPERTKADLVRKVKK
jgi:hypothetical protein